MKAFLTNPPHFARCNVSLFNSTIPIVININGFVPYKDCHCSPTHGRSPPGLHPYHQTSTLAPSSTPAHAAGASAASYAPFVQLFAKSATSSFHKGKFP